MTDVINVETVDRLSRVYSHVDDIDLFTGGLSERPVTGGVVGPTFACIIGQQFLNLRKGDRFWYENGNHPGAFKADQLQEIRRASLSRVICDNLDDIESLQPFAFLTVDGFSNQRKACKGTGKICQKKKKSIDLIFKYGFIFRNSKSQFAIMARNSTKSTTIICLQFHFALRFTRHRKSSRIHPSL